MTKRCIWLKGVVLTSAVVFGSSCCASFKSVQATSDLGKELGADPDILTHWEFDCESLQARQASDTCRKPEYRAALQSVTDVTGLLVQYATALGNAAGAKDLSVKDDLDAALTTFGKLNTDNIKAKVPELAKAADFVSTDQPLAGKVTPTAVADAVDAIAQLITREIRREDIKKAVEAANPHVSLLASFVAAEARLQEANLEMLRNEQLDLLISSRPGASHDARISDVAAGVLLPQAYWELDDRIRRLKKLEATAESFRVAHDKLLKSPKGDEELLGDIKTAVQQIAHDVRDGTKPGSSS